MIFTIPAGGTVQIVYAASDSHIPPVDQYVIANLDTVNAVYVGPADGNRQAPDLASAIARDQLVALQGITISSALDWYVFNPNTAAVQIDVIPDGRYWGPSPAQAAIQIAETGVGLINFKTAYTLATSQTVTAGATANLTMVMGINQPSYNLHLTCTAGASSTNPLYTVTLQWIDSTSGLTVQVDAFTSTMSSTSNVMSTVIQGPTDADQLQVSVTNLDSKTMTINTAYIIISSRPNYTTDIVYQFWTTATMPSVPGFQIGANVPVPTNRVLFSLTRSLANGATTTPDYILPVYSGRVAIGFNGQTSNNWDVVFTDQLTGVFIYRITLSSTNNSYTEYIFPRCPVSMHITNNGSLSGTINCEVVAT